MSADDGLVYDGTTVYWDPLNVKYPLEGKAIKYLKLQEALRDVETRKRLSIAMKSAYAPAFREELALLGDLMDEEYADLDWLDDDGGPWYRHKAEHPSADGLIKGNPFAKVDVSDLSKQSDMVSAFLYLVAEIPESGVPRVTGFETSIGPRTAYEPASASNDGKTVIRSLMYQVNDTTIEKAISRLRIESAKQFGKGILEWFLPDDPDSDEYREVQAKLNALKNEWTSSFAQNDAVLSFLKLMSGGKITGLPDFVKDRAAALVTSMELGE